MVRVFSFIAAAVSLAFAGPAMAGPAARGEAPTAYAGAPAKISIAQKDLFGQHATPARATGGVPQAMQPPQFASVRLLMQTKANYALTVREPAVDRSDRDYRRGVAQFGPFVVIDDRRVALVGETDERTPAAFRMMMLAYPGLSQLDMIECPGTRDDRANLALGRMLRAARFVTHVPPIGSVRSGAVELFFAGVKRDIADGAEFAVHSWMDEYGRQPADFSAEAPENRQYVDYYREMGMPYGQARAFYAMTNSVPHSSARWLDASTMRGWLTIRAEQAAGVVAVKQRLHKAGRPRVEYASLAHS